MDRLYRINSFLVIDSPWMASLSATYRVGEFKAPTECMVEGSKMAFIHTFNVLITCHRALRSP